ncbi:hypothetical protein WG904_18320 [Pedobacter sp. Du54]|uniref:hypothetical protein n=1 Tax=Pedobacter anseongensis TaxID=3133439 RepID=UPI0030A9AD30
MNPINVPTIPVDEAIGRVTRFREKMIKSGAIPESNIPRAVLIPIDDLLAIIQKYTTVDDDGNVRSTLTGVRTYFAIKANDQDLPDEVTALVVAVDKEGNDLINTTAVGLGEGGDGSDIYDFTKPCPSECDPESPLFVP